MVSFLEVLLKLFLVALRQCGNMARLFFNIGPFITMEVCPKAFQFTKDGLIFCHILILAYRNSPKSCRILPICVKFHQIWSHCFVDFQQNLKILSRHFQRFSYPHALDRSLDYFLDVSRCCRFCTNIFYWNIIHFTHRHGYKNMVLEGASITGCNHLWSNF